MDWPIYLFFIILLATVLYSTLSLAPWVPTRKKDLGRILSLSVLKPNENFFDLGCGTGRINAYIAKHTEANSIGIELSLPLYFACLIRQLLSNKKNLAFIFNNIRLIDLSKADAVFIFGASREKLSGSLIKKLEKELKPGTRVLSYTFPITSWEPSVIDKPSEKDVSIYQYIR